MRILFFIDSLASGGKERRMVELIKGIKSDIRIEFELVVMSKDIHYKEVLDLEIAIHYLIRTAKKDITVFKTFYKICRNFQPDVVHCWDGMTALIAVPTCQLLHIKLVNGMVVDTPVKRNIFNKNWFRAKLTFPFSSRIIGNSKAGLAAYGASPKKSSCIYNGMDFNRFKQLKHPKSVYKEILGSESSNYFIAGMVASFEERKDYKTLVEAAISLTSKYDNIRFVLVGDGAGFGEIRKMVPPLLFNKIILLGRRSDVESIVNIFSVGILLTNTSVHGEGISNSLIEYMALAKPVIATSGGGTNEVVLDTKNGYLIGAFNKDQLIERIELLMNNENLLKDLGSKSYQIAKEKFDLKIMTSHYLEVYQQLFKK